MSDSLQKLQMLLEKLFRADAADLDFGIYRIINKKSVEMDSFLYCLPFFIVSKTPFEKLRHRVGIEQQELQTMWHILFPDDVDPTYLSPIFEESAG